MRRDQQTVLSANSKANIYLRILRRRPDGYHDLDSLFVPLENPHDRLHVVPKRDPGLELGCSHPALGGRDNILHTAYALFCQASGRRPGIHVWLEKSIPQGAGLGGGSSDAASLLKYLNDLSPRENRLSHERLLDTAKQVGADVPFFLSNVPAWVGGIGEKIEPVTLDVISGWLLIACPKEQVATAWAYKTWDKTHGHMPGLPGLTRNKKPDKDSACTAGRVFWNSFEPIVYKAFPVLFNVKCLLLTSGARAAVLSGSGSAIVGLFKTEQECHLAQNLLDQKQITVYRQKITPWWGVAKW